MCSGLAQPGIRTRVWSWLRGFPRDHGRTDGGVQPAHNDSHRSFQRTDGLLVPQGDHRIDAHGAASRDVTGGQRNAEQNDRHRSESHWIGCGNTIEQARHEARQQKRRN